MISHHNNKRLIGLLQASIIIPLLIYGAYLIPAKIVENEAKNEIKMILSENLYLQSAYAIRQPIEKNEIPLKCRELPIKDINSIIIMSSDSGDYPNRLVFQNGLKLLKTTENTKLKKIMIFETDNKLLLLLGENKIEMDEKELRYFLAYHDLFIAREDGIFRRAVINAESRHVTIRH